MTEPSRHRKLIEVALPLDVINEEGARDKSLNRGHPKSLHWWWARRPLAVARAVIFAQLVDDPSSHPERFPTESAQEQERERLFALLRELVSWENSGNKQLMENAFKEIAACFDGDVPVVVDPFCGGGTIPVEARRLGLRTIGSDLNPVAALITKAMVEVPARFTDRPPLNEPSSGGMLGRDWSGSRGLAADVDHYGKVLIEQAHAQVANLFSGPADIVGQGEVPLAWIWARAVVCPNPACGSWIPLVNSWWLSNPSKPSATRRRSYLVPMQGDGFVSPALERDGEPPPGTVRQNSVTCPRCSSATDVDYVKQQGVDRGLAVQLLAILVDRSGRREYRSVSSPPVVEDAIDVGLAGEQIPFHPQYLQLPRYGITTFANMFTNRQLRFLAALVHDIDDVRRQIVADGGTEAYADAVVTYLGFLVDRIANRNSSFSFWNPAGDKVEAATANNYVAMRWTFAEANPFANASGGAQGQLDFLVKAIASLPAGPDGQGLQLDAVRATPPSGAAFCTDPPYFDNVPYADLSDFYYVWLKRTVGNLYPDLFSTILTPKESELVADSSRHGGPDEAATFFREGFKEAFDRMAQASHPDVPIVIYYALRQRETARNGDVVSTGWEQMLQGLVDAGLTVTATWPFRTEKRGGLRSHGRNALASSVVIACRPRQVDAPLATTVQLMTSMRAELAPHLKTLQREGISAVDLDQAMIGPGMSVFSGYARVMEADGSPMSVRKALALINRVIDELRTEEEGDLDPESRFAAAWFSEFGFREGEFGRADDLARAKNVAVQGIVDAGIAASRPGKFRLLSPEELDGAWDPLVDARLTVWEVTHQMLARLDSGGDRAAADLARKVGGLADAALALAYRLYAVSEQKGWAQVAARYDSLVVAWPEIRRLADETQVAQPEQTRLGG